MCSKHTFQQCIKYEKKKKKTLDPPNIQLYFLLNSAAKIPTDKSIDLRRLTTITTRPFTSR